MSGDLNEIRKQLDSLLRLEIKPEHKTETEQEKSDREFAKEMLGNGEPTDSLVYRILQNDFIALQVRFNSLESVNEEMGLTIKQGEEQARSLINMNDLLRQQAEELIVLERVLATLTCVTLLLGAIAAVVL